MVVNIVDGAMGHHMTPCRRGGILTSHVKSDGKVSRGLSPPPIVPIKMSLHLAFHNFQPHCILSGPKHCSKCLSSTCKSLVRFCMTLPTVGVGKCHPCWQCGHTAYCSSSLVKHMCIFVCWNINVIHLKLGPNLCNLCEFKAATKSNLKLHEQHFHAHTIVS